MSDVDVGAPRSRPDEAAALGDTGGVRYQAASQDGGSSFCIVRVQVEKEATIRVLGPYVPPGTADDQACAEPVSLAESVVARLLS